MKKSAVILLLSLFVCFSGFNQDKKKKSRKARNLTEKIETRLDSIIRTPVFETIQGREYYRFSNGVLEVVNTNSISGVFILNDRIYFSSHNGEIVFSEMDETGRCYEKTLEQLLFALEKEW